MTGPTQQLWLISSVEILPNFLISQNSHFRVFNVSFYILYFRLMNMNECMCNILPAGQCIAFTVFQILVLKTKIRWLLDFHVQYGFVIINATVVLKKPTSCVKFAQVMEKFCLQVHRVKQPICEPNHKSERVCGPYLT